MEQKVPTITDPSIKKKVRGFMTSAYDDYVAARFLLNNEFFLQGAILACTAIEKYLKAIVVFINPERKIKRVHLDNLDILKGYFRGTPFESIFNDFDEVFIYELKTIYRFRYHDNISQPTSIGFLVNQFLGELDFIVTYINERIGFPNADGTLEETIFWRNVKQFNKALFDNNFTLLQLDKVEFMNRETHGYSYYIHPDKQNVEGRTNFKVVPGKNIHWGNGIREVLPLYTGKILPFRMHYNDKELS